MCNVYVIDDDPIHQKITGLLIKRTGLFNKHMQFDGAIAALAYLEEHKNDVAELPDVILLDLNMPELDGWGFLEEFGKLRSQLDKNIIIYIVSSSTIQSEIDRSTTYPYVKDFITKPLDIHKLEEVYEVYASSVSIKH